MNNIETFENLAMLATLEGVLEEKDLEVLGIYVQKLKKDLEVLEILKKYIKVEYFRPWCEVALKPVYRMFVFEKIPDTIADCMPHFITLSRKDLIAFTPDELQKIKEWINGDKNE